MCLLHVGRSIITKVLQISIFSLSTKGITLMKESASALYWQLTKIISKGAFFFVDVFSIFLFSIQAILCTIIYEWLVQLSWNYYNFALDFCFDDKTENLWTVWILRSIWGFEYLHPILVSLNFISHLTMAVIDKFFPKKT